MKDIENITKSRIEQQLKEIGTSARKASLLAGLSADTLGKYLSGHTRSLTARNLSALARILGVSESWLAGTDEQRTTETQTGVRFGGLVEAGTWRINDSLNQDADFRVIPIPLDPRYPREAQFAFEVVGDSMTEVGIFEGMFVLGVDTHAWQRLHGEPGDGKLVVVARTRNGESERELTVKQLRLFRDRMELQPKSKNPTWKPLVFPFPPREDEQAEANIIAVVLSATRIY